MEGKKKKKNRTKISKPTSKLKVKLFLLVGYLMPKPFFFLLNDVQIFL